MSGQGLAMRYRIRSLMREHRVRPEPCVIPLSDPWPHDMILEGYASTTDLDLDRVKMRPYAFPIIPWSKTFPPLFFKHDPQQVAGSISELAYDDFGNLMCWCTVTHDLAKRCGAFSIAAKVIDYEIKNADSPDNFFAIINQAELTEISLTDNPSNPFALVHDRHRVSPQVQFLDLLGEKVKRLQQLTVLIKQEIRT